LSGGLARSRVAGACLGLRDSRNLRGTATRSRASQGKTPDGPPGPHRGGASDQPRAEAWLVALPERNLVVLKQRLAFPYSVVNGFAGVELLLLG